MAEVGTRSSMTSNHEIEIVYSAVQHSDEVSSTPFEPLFIVHATDWD